MSVALLRPAAPDTDAPLSRLLRARLNDASTLIGTVEWQRRKSALLALDFRRYDARAELRTLYERLPEMRAAAARLERTVRGRRYQSGTGYQLDPLLVNVWELDTALARCRLWKTLSDTEWRCFDGAVLGHLSSREIAAESRGTIRAETVERYVRAVVRALHSVIYE